VYNALAGFSLYDGFFIFDYANDLKSMSKGREQNAPCLWASSLDSNEQQHYAKSIKLVR
jgi:hypothetical protein